MNSEYDANWRSNAGINIHRDHTRSVRDGGGGGGGGGSVVPMKISSQALRRKHSKDSPQQSSRCPDGGDLAIAKQVVYSALGSFYDCAEQGDMDVSKEPTTNANRTAPCI